MKTIAYQFDEMMIAMGHRGVTGVQRTEMRRAFYGGFAIAMATMNEIADNPVEDEAMRCMASLAEELRRFYQSVGTAGL